VHLMDILRLRPVPAAAVFLSLTRRCPLTCRHCSTNSLMTSEEHAEELFSGFVDTFTPDSRPELVYMTGGEALLRPRLVEDIAHRAREAGTRSQVLSGMFFARGGRIPPAIRRAIDAVDHFSASLDIFHEEQVSRAAVLRVLGDLVEDGKDVSIQVVGVDDDDPYLAEVTDDIRRTLDDRVPIVVSHVGPVGRAAEWLPKRRVTPPHPGTAEPFPCGMAAWPVVVYDGTVVACCNQRVTDGDIPDHLRLGHAATDDWATIRERALTSGMLRAIRVFGPQYLADQYGTVACDGYCSTCQRLSDDDGVIAGAAALAGKPTLPLLENQVLRIQQEAGPVGFIRNGGSQRYAELVTLGYQREAAACAG
jgi:pyruvate-formate lyase-activating enzyme